MKHIFAVLLLVLFAGMADARTPASYGLLDMTEKSDIVVHGTVETMTSYYDANVRNGKIMTDIIVRANQFVKGQATLGRNHVRFAIKGGTAYVPKQDKVMTYRIFPSAKFAIGEEVLLFLRVGTADGYYKDFPHGRLHLHMNEVGKKTIGNSAVVFGYEFESKVKRTHIPLDLTKLLVQSYVKDKNGAKAIENEIKGLVTASSRDEFAFTLPTVSVNKFKKNADKIIKKEAE